MDSSEILEFWFGELSPKDWWRKDAELDAAIRRRFLPHLQAARAGELWRWRASAQGRLAEIIVLDQFSRNIHRDTADAFAADGMALVLAQEAVDRGADAAMPPPRRAFLYLPYMHSESLAVHERAVELYSARGLEYNLDFELRHKAVIERFGRYPHRNAVLGRASSEEEEAFLREPGSSF